MTERRVSGLTGLQQAFDEVRFGATRTLNLRATLPTAHEAVQRVERWLREHQVQRSGEVLVITGRGNNSEDGVSVVREATLRLMHELRRKGIIEAFAEHTAGSFVVTLAPMKAMLDATRRRREQTPLPPPADPPTLAALPNETRKRLRMLAECSLDALGVREREPFVEGEMLRLFGSLAATVPAGPDRERRLDDAIASAMRDYD
ncbi:MAG: Smr/MutS family protein [Gemmatimonadaceae bacterium]|nr:Smr/MutS family protein [Gemmatimonadaceae bacterium]